MQCTVCPPHGLATGMGLCGSGSGFAGQCFAVWQRSLPRLELLRAWSGGSFSRMDALLLLLWLLCAVYRVAMLCAAVRLLWQQPEAEVQP
mgnify:CR=1 FL=1